MKLRFVAASALAGALLVGVAIGAASKAPVARHRETTVSSQAQADAARAAVMAVLQGNRDRGVRAHRHAIAGPSGSTNTFYYNWLGYADTGAAGSFTKVAGSWTVSKLGTCTGEHTTVSEWIGFDGFTNGTVEQDGSLSMCYEGKPVYDDWYEMYPTQSVITVEHSVSPGDHMSATVTRSGTKYTLVVTDSTHSADSFTATATCSATTCQNDSAEWINERNDFAAAGYSPLSDFGTWTLTGGTGTKSGKSGSIGSLGNVNNITMIDATDAYNLGTASALSGGNSFTTTWQNSW